MKAEKENNAIDPDRTPITNSQATRLAAFTDLKVLDLVGLTVVQISERFKWRIDPQLLIFKKICGQVVKKDPVTGVAYPVPFATVHVEDTDCSFLGLFPINSKWSWLFPFRCRREEIATVITDKCGRFCVYIPRWEVDWILRFRRERICFPDIFTKPSLRDILGELREPVIVRPPHPEPDPLPFLLKDGGFQFRRAEDLIGKQNAATLAQLQASASFGSNTRQLEQFLDQPAFTDALQPQLPKEFQTLGHSKSDNAELQLADAIRGTLATRLNLDKALLEGLDVQRFVGPFRRCVDILVPEWTPILDVPDITFRVTQDVDGDGDEETIYSEGFFDVRWNAGSIPDVTLEASPIAVAGKACETPVILCKDKPAILFAGLLPLTNPAAPVDPYFDAVAGYARRPNRPHPSGDLIDPLPNPLATTPFTGTLQLYGCNELKSAAFYRLRYSFNGGALVPFTGISWPLYRNVGGVLQVHWPVPDANGWYPVIPGAQNWFPENLLLEWPTTSFPNGKYTVQLELGNAAKAIIDTSAQVRFRVDNSNPITQVFEIRWRKAGGVWSAPLPSLCPVVPRQKVSGTPVDLEFEVAYQVSAAHLRSVALSGGGCGGTNPVLTSALNTTQHWHQNALDNFVSKVATYSLNGSTAPQGAYSFSLFCAARAFNPSGGDGGHLADWNYDPVYNYIQNSFTFAIVDA